LFPRLRVGSEPTTCPIFSVFSGHSVQENRNSVNHDHDALSNHYGRVVSQQSFESLADIKGRQSTGLNQKGFPASDSPAMPCTVQNSPTLTRDSNTASAHTDTVTRTVRFQGTSNTARLRLLPLPPVTTSTGLQCVLLARW
jgi:hypothetical protein